MRPRQPIRRAVRLGTVISVAAAVGTVLALTVPPWHSPVRGHQLGYRASSMIQWDQTVQAATDMNRPPANVPPERFGVQAAALQDTRPAGEVYKNLKVLPGGTAGEFMRLHIALTNWVAPQQGCAFCHAGKDPAEDTPRKSAAQLMIQMTQTLNANWRDHLGEQGVTCYTCHRGQNIPSAVWALRDTKLPPPFIAKQDDWNETATTVRDFFPVASAAEYLLQDTPGRAQSYTALPSTGPKELVVVKRLYEVMMQMSDGIGVNCGYCHNSRAFFDWGQSTPARWTGANGIHMTQAINNDFLQKLHAAMPQSMEVAGSGRPPITPLAESGPQNGNGFVNCQTCHYSSPHPLPGQNLLAGFPALAKPAAAGGTP